MIKLYYDLNDFIVMKQLYHLTCEVPFFKLELELHVFLIISLPITSMLLHS